MGQLPNQVNAQAIAGSVWDCAYQLYNDDGSLMDITTKSFELSIRPAVTDTAPSPILSANSQQATAQGYITINTSTSTVTVVLNSAGTTLLGRGARPYALWMNPNLVDATDLVVGTFYSVLAANP